MQFAPTVLKMGPDQSTGPSPNNYTVRKTIITIPGFVSVPD